MISFFFVYFMLTCFLFDFCFDLHTAGARVELNNKWGYIVSKAGTGEWDGGRKTNNSWGGA